MYLSRGPVLARMDRFTHGPRSVQKCPLYTQASTSTHPSSNPCHPGQSNPTPHGHTYTFVHTCIPIYLHVHTLTHIRAFIHSFNHSLIRAYIHTYIRTAHAHTHAHTHTHTHIHTHTHTHNNSPPTTQKDVPANSTVNMYLPRGVCVRIQCSMRLHACADGKGPT